MKNIVLFNPRASRYGNPVGAPLGLLSICRNLDRYRFNIKIYSSWIDSDYQDRILYDCRDALCFGVTSMTGYQILEGLRMSEMVKVRYPDIPIVWGGYHPTLLPEETILNKNIDIVVRGQGEITFKELVNCLSEGRVWASIRGLTYKKGNNVISNPDRPIADINTFADLPYDLLNMEKYIHVSRIGLRTIEYVSSVGCTFDCGFCVEPKVYGRRWFPLKAERVVNEIEVLVRRFGVDSILLQETNFFMDEQRIKRICGGLIKKNIKIAWGDANGRAPQLVRYDKSTWQLMRESGCKNILIGAESALQSVLEYLNKRANIYDTIEVADISYKYGISVTFSMMVGMPPDQKVKVTPQQELAAIISLSRRIMAKSRLHIILVFAYTPYPGTLLYNRSLDTGFKAPGNLEQWGQVELHTRSTPWMKLEDINLLDYLTNFLFRYVSSSSHEYIRRQRNILKKLSLGLIYLDANFRWQINYFGLLWEYRVYMFILRLRSKRRRAVS